MSTGSTSWKRRAAAAAAAVLTVAASVGPAAAYASTQPAPAGASASASVVNAWRDMGVNVRSIAKGKPAKVFVTKVPAGVKSVTLWRLSGKKWVRMAAFPVKNGKATVTVPGKFVKDSNRTFAIRAGKLRSAFTLNASLGATRLTTAPGVVAGVQATAFSTYADITWGPSGRATSFLVEISADGGATYSIAGSTTASVRKLTVSGLTLGTEYIVRVSGVNSDGAGPAAFTTFTTQLNPPAGITGLVATPLDSAVNLDWANAARATSYQVERTCVQNSGFSPSVCPVDVRTTVPSAFNWSGLKNDTEYLFRVRGVNQDGTGPGATVVATPLSKPVPVGNVVPTPGNGAIFARWTPSVNADEYRLAVSPTAVTKWVYTQWSTKTSAFVDGLTNGDSYKLLVQARNKYGYSNSTQSNNIVPSASAPSAVEGLSAKPGDSQVTLTWDVDPSASSYTVMHRAIGEENFVAAPPAPPAASNGTVTRTVSNLINGTEYEFEVYASNSSGRSIPALTTSTPSFNAQFRGLPAPRGAVGRSGVMSSLAAKAAGEVSAAALPAPATVTATPYSGRAVVTWTAVTSATGYTVSYASSPSGPWTTFTTTASNVRTANVTGLTNNSAYYFQVAALGGDATVAGPVTPIAVPGPVSNLSAWPSNGSIVVTWTGVSSATQYRVLYRPSTSSTWSPAVFVTSPTTSYTIPTLANGTAYYVQVAAINSSGAGTTTQAGPTTPSASVPATPGPITATPASGQVTLEWPSVAGADGYQVFTQGVTGLSSLPPSTVAAGEEEYTISGLTNGTPYNFVVVAYNDYGVSNAANVGPVTPGSSAPSAPTNLVATAGDGSASIAFTPAVSPDSPVVNYAYSVNNGPLTPASPVTASSPVVITGLTNGTTYSIELAAVNAAGQTSPTSSAVSVTPVAATVAPPSGLVATPGNGSASIAFTQTGVPSGASITNYSYSLNGGATWTALSPAQTTSPVTISGLTNGTSYSISLQAAASNGTTSAASDAVQVTPASTPSAPTGLSAAAGNGTATITFTPGANGGSAITNYAYSTNGGTSWTPLSPPDASSPITITGLTNGTTYSITLAAINAVGQGASSAAVSVTPVGAPAAPTGLVVTPGDGSANLTWDATATATGYNVWLTCGILSGESAPQSGVGCPQISWPTANTTFNINSATSAGLGNGITYAVAVQAVNAAGTGPKTAWVNVTPGTTPAAPTDVVGSGVDGGAVIAFTPGANNGAAITNYEYSTDGGSTWTALSPAQTASPITIDGLTNGTAYSIEIAAVNSFGQGAASSAVNVTPASNPSAPTDLVATPGDGTVSVAFTAGDNGGASITNYEYSTDGGSTWTAFSPAAVASPVTITGLTNGTTYDIALQAVTSAGTSSASEVVVATPFGVPAAPTALVATAGDEQISISFTAGSDNGASISNYAYSLNGGALTPLPIPQTGSPVVIAGLTNGTEYTVALAAINAAGTGATSTATSAVTPFTTPDAPTDLVATPGDDTVSVAFTAGSSNGSAITNYVVSIDGGDTWTALSPSQTTSPIVFSGLSNGTEYELGIAPVNAAGQGGAAFVTATPFTNPAAPTINTVTAGNESVSVDITAGDNGGSPIANYEYSLNGGAWVALSPAQTTGPISISGLTNGTEYTVALKAVNEAGATSPASNTSSSFTPFTVPSAPTSLSATAGDDTASIAFTPATEGGYPIANYVYTLNAGTTQTAFSPATTTSPVEITGLVNGTAYTIALAAVDSQGNQGPWSAPVNVTPEPPATVPGAPTDVTGTPTAATTADVSWDAPASDGGSELTSYTVTVSPSAGVTITQAAFPATTATLSGLAAGQSYTVSVTAANEVGDSEAGTSAAFNTGTLTPTNLAAAVSDNAVQLTWDATSGAGSYLVYECAVVAPATSCNPVTDDTSPTSTTASPYTYTLNWSTTYNFAVAAVADSITGPASASVAATIGDIPVPAEPAVSWYPQPTNSGTGGTTVAWSAVDYADYYTCNGTNIGTDMTCSATAAPDTQISYSIEACNASGCSTAVTQNTATNPIGSTQSAPTWVYTSQSTPGGDRCVTVSWDAFATSNQYVFNANGGVPGDVWNPITGTSFEWCGADATTDYVFTVQGVNQLTLFPPNNWDTTYYGNATPNSSSFGAAPPAPTVAPTAVPGNAIDLSSSSDYGNVALSWPSQTGAFQYAVNRVGISYPWQTFTPSYQDTGLEWNTSYTYEIASCNNQGCSAYGPTTTVTTAPAPALFSISTIGAGQTGTIPGSLFINVAAMPSGAGSYQIYACDSSINPGCNPYTSGTGFGWITTTGFLQTQISGLNSGDSYNIGVLSAQGSAGGGLNTQAVQQSTTSP